MFCFSLVFQVISVWFATQVEPLVSCRDEMRYVSHMYEHLYMLLQSAPVTLNIHPPGGNMVGVLRAHQCEP